jgi:hypothetical protein
MLLISVKGNKMNFAFSALVAILIVALMYFIHLYIKYFADCPLCGGNGNYLDAERYEHHLCPRCKGSGKLYKWL